MAALFERRAGANPAAVAVRDDDGSATTLGELSERAAALAAALRSVLVGEAGVGPGGSSAVVAVCVGRSVSYLVAVLGVLKAGAAFLPIATGDPAPRVQRLLACAGVRCCLAEQGAAAGR